MSRFIVLEVPDSYDFKKKFASHQVMACCDEDCGYHTIDPRLMVEHMFYDPRHHNLPRRENERVAASR